MDNGKYSGKLIVVDGLDGIGKGVGLDAIVERLREQGIRVLDLHDFWKNHNHHPDFQNPLNGDAANPLFVDPDSFDVIYSSEPTYVGVGKMIRTETTAHSGRDYDVATIANMFSIDREILYKRVHLPALKKGKTILQSRCVSTSIAYQTLQAQDEKSEIGLDHILNLKGNSFALENAPHLLIIPTITNPEELAERLAGRDKDDNSIFENVKFQMAVKAQYESAWFRKLFEDRGTQIEFYDAGVSVEHSQNEALRIFSSYMGQQPYSNQQ